MLVISKYCLFLTIILAIYPTAIKAEKSPQNIKPNLVTIKKKYSSWAYGNLERRDWIELYHTHYRCRQFGSCSLSLYQVQRILGFSGEKTKVSTNGNVKNWIWIDLEKQNKQVKATFVRGKLTRLKGIGF